MGKVKIAFVGNYKYNCGSSNTLLGYVRAGENLNFDIRVSDFGYIDEVIRSSIPVAGKSWRPDLLVIVYESYPFLSNEQIDQICSFIPRSKRIVIDPDGKYSRPISFGGDTNHPTFDSCDYWTSLYDSLSDVILQPFISEAKTKKVQQFLYFGMDNNASGFTEQPKDFDLLYVGNNWYRWHDIKWLIEAIAPIRLCLKKVALIGQYWGDEVMEEFKEATYSDSDLNFLKRNQIEIHDSVPYGQVEMAMSRGLLNPIFIRPILNKLKFVTPRMFETLLADTIPLIPNYFSYAPNLYGNDIKQLTFSLEHIAEDTMQILENYEENKKLVRNIREALRKQHSYEVRLKQLLQYI